MKLNKNGQVLVLFVIIVPIILVLIAFIIDTSLINIESNKATNITNSIIKDYQKGKIDNSNQVYEIYEENDISTTNLEVSITKDTIKIENEYEINSLFGNIIGKNSYKIKIQEEYKRKE